MNTKILIGGAAAVLAIILFFWLTGDDEPDGDARDAASLSAEEMDQIPPASGDTRTNSSAGAEQNDVLLRETETGNFVTVARARLNTSGYIVIYQVNSNSVSDSVGRSDLLAPGTYDDLTIQLNSVLAEEQTVVAVLHSDDGDGKFEGIPADAYLTNANESVVTDVDVVDTPFAEEAPHLQAQVDTYVENNAEVFAN